MIGSVLRARYEVVQAIGETQLFQVFSARDRLQGREVCIRLLKPPYASEPEFVQKLNAVVQEMASVQDPSLEQLYAVDGDEGTPFLVSELSKGTPLNERLRKLGAFSVPVAVGTAIIICEALQALHRDNFCHGDVGLHSTVMNSDGEVKLQLPGIWRAYSASPTAGQAVLASMAAYLAPEINRGAMPGPKSDVYAVGVLLYELLAGRGPFHAENPAAMAVKHINEAPPNVRMMNPSVPIALAEVIKKAMSKDPAVRYFDAGDMVTDLRILQDALRFGRTLSWPIRDTGPAPQETVQVAPTMGAIRQDPRPKKPEKQKPGKEPKPAREKDLYEPDVPIWLKTLIAFFAGLLVILVGLWIAYNMTKPKLVRVPDLRRLTFSEATTRLSDLGLKVRVSKRLVSETVPSEQVITSQPAPGESIFSGSSVNIVVSLGSQFVQVPDLKGETVDQARAIASSVNLQLDPNIESVANKAPKGTIISQEPEKGSKTTRLSSIKIKVSTGEVTEDKNDKKKGNQKYIVDLVVTLSDITEPVELKVEVTDRRGTRVIHNQMHDPEERVPLTAETFGDTATFKIYYDGDLVKTQEVKGEPQDVENGGQN